MRVLVTGGAGFIGSPVVDALWEHGHEPVGYDVRADPGADVRDPVAVARAPAGVDGVCRQAAVVGLGAGFAGAAEYVSRNGLGTAVLFEAMARAGVRRLVPAGSMVCTARDVTPVPGRQYGAGVSVPVRPAGTTFAARPESEMPR
jgi:dTDP-L-rhamnose 4-epimerase